MSTTSSNFSPINFSQIITTTTDTVSAALSKVSDKASAIVQDSYTGISSSVINAVSRFDQLTPTQFALFGVAGITAFALTRNANTSRLVGLGALALLVGCTSSTPKGEDTQETEGETGGDDTGGASEVFYDHSEEGPEDYSAGGTPWSTTSLTYAFSNSASSLSETGSENAIQEALAIWQGACSTLEFTETDTSSADIVIGWYEGEHGDGYPFDGGGSSSGNTLAHAFYPTNGDTHFDDYEIWSYASSVPTGEYDLVTVALHEFGHALGLGHSTDTDAIMYPSYSGMQRYLGTDDRDGIQFRYSCDANCDVDEDDFEAIECGGEDCDDEDDDINPDASENCSDGIDNDCNGVADDDDAACIEDCEDNDSDGYGVGDDCPEEDCNDSDSSIYPNAQEYVGNSTDEDCDGDAPTIQEALDDAEDCETILVEPGTYYENITFPNVDCPPSLVSTSGASSTIIDGSDSGIVVTFYNGPSDTPARIEGFTLQNGSEIGGSLEGGIVNVGSNVEIVDNIIRYNTGMEDVVGFSAILVYGGDSYIDGNEIYDNYGYLGAGMYFSRGSEEGTVTNNYIHDNEGWSSACCYTNGSADLSFSGNSCVDNVSPGYPETQNCW